MAQSKPLSRDEIIYVIPLLKEIFKNLQSPIFAPELKLRLQQRCDEEKISYRVAESRMRQMINFLRSNTILPIIGDRNGYYLAKDNVQIMAQATSLKERAASINAAASGMAKFVI